MDNNLVLTFDVGTQSTRGMIIDQEGQIVLLSQVKYDSPYLPAKSFGEAEQSPDFYYQQICKASLLLKEKDPENKVFPLIKGVTISCIRDTVLILDKDNKPLRNIIVWMDDRRAPGKPTAPWTTRFLLWLVGMKETVEMLYKDAFYNWIREQEPEIWAKTSKFVMLPGYINYKLTGNLKDGVANQVGHIPFDNKKRKWMVKGLSRCVADIPLENLIDLVESGEIIGTINHETALNSAIPEGIPLYASGTDKACEALGLSVVGPEKAAVSLGTAASIQFCTDKYFEPEPFLPSYPSVIPGYFNAENQIYRGYWTVTWFKNEFCQYEVAEAERRGISTEELLDTYLDDVPIGCNGLIMTPHMAPGAGNPFSKAVITGLSDRHSKKHLYRAIIEGIDFELFHAMKRMERRSGFKIKEIYIAGGGSKCDKILQITADLFGLPVKKGQSPEATSIGSSIAAFVGMGVYKDFTEAVQHMAHEGDVFLPDMDNHEQYMEIYNNIYSKIEKTNLHIFRKIKKVLKSKLGSNQNL